MNVPSPEQLLQYLPAYGVIVCTECGYAIQPNAISRHLKDIHQLYRSTRRPYTKYVSQFKARSAEDVISSEILKFPVSLLPVFDGLRCQSPGCGHLCVSIKRMQNHWLFVHGRHACQATDWCSAPLQTFFRGNLIHYFTDSSADHSHPLKQVRHPFPHNLIPDEPETNYIQHETAAYPDVRHEITVKGQVDTRDDFLLHHYLKSTYLTLVDRHGADDAWQIGFPQLAQSNPFLMHGILACSALHLAYESTSEKQAYLISARGHQDIAMRLFRKAIEQISESNCNAILAFSHLLVIYSLAEERPDESLLLANTSESHQELLSNWLYFVRNGCLLVCDFWDRIENGPLAMLAASWEIPIMSTGTKTSELSSFIRLLSHLEGVEWSQDACSTCRTAALSLEMAFGSADALNQEFTIWDAVRVWPMSVSAEYIQLINQEHPAALVLLAHYCLLLVRLKSIWYVAEAPYRVLAALMARLDSRWHPHVPSLLESTLG